MVALKNIMFLKYDNWFYLILSTAIFGIAIAFVCYGQRRRKRKMTRIFNDSRMTEKLTCSVNHAARKWRDSLLIAAVAFTCLALARPQWGFKPMPAPDYSRDVMIAIDCSRSMLASDLKPNRLEYAKWLCRKLVERDSADRYGILAFAGQAFLECPLTRDRETLRSTIDGLNTNTIPVGGTNLQAALKTARLAFKGAEQEFRGILLITDGEELQGQGAAELDYFKDNNIPLIILGLGNPNRGAVVQLETGEFLRDAQGNVVQTKLREDILTQLTTATNGLYVRAGNDETALRTIDDKIKSLTPKEDTEKIVRQPIERYQTFLAIALALALFRLFIPERRRQKKETTPSLRQTGVVIILACSALTFQGCKQKNEMKNASSTTVANAVAPAESTIKESTDNDNTLIELQELLESAKDDEKASIHYNIGTVHERSGNEEQARNAYENAISNSGDNDQVRGLALWNLAVMTHKKALQMAGKNQIDDAEKLLQQTGDMYREALDALEGNENLGENFEKQHLLLKEIERMRKLKKMEQAAQQAVADALKQQKEVIRQNTMPKRKDAKISTDTANEKVESFVQATEKINTNPENRKRLKQLKQHMQSALLEQKKAMELARRPENIAQTDENAEDHLSKALKLLGGAQEQNDDSENKETDENKEDNDSQTQKNKDKNQGQKQEQSGQAKENNQTTPQSKHEEEQEQARQQAAKASKNEAGKLQNNGENAVLRQLLENEENLRDAIKLHQMRGAEPSRNNW